MIEPIVSYTVSAVLVAAMPYAIYLAQKYLHLQINAQAQATLQAAVSTEAGKLVAAAADNLVNKQVDVGSSIVAEATDSLLKRAPDILKNTGLTVNDVDHMIAGAIGAFQAGHPVPVATASK
jgi:hypothetical protein